MLGSGVSSESIWTAFDSVTTAVTRILRWALRISWKRAENANIVYATVGTSLVNGLHIVQGVSTVITKPDNFQYYDESDRVIGVEYDRELNEPLGGIAMATLDVELENTDSRYTPDHSATIGTAILPNRPINTHIGFEVKSQNKTIGLFKGLTKLPKENKVRRTVKISSIDYIQYLNEFELESDIYVSQRTDQIIEDILTTIGFASTQYSLDTGLNTIGFAWFEKGQTAGERIRRLCEAEEGFFFQDEDGILKFENRRHFQNAPFNSYVWTIDPDDIMSWESDDSSVIINKVTVNANPRHEYAISEVWRDGVEEEIATGETKEIWASFDNPIVTLTNPVVNTDYTAYSGTGGTGSDISSDIVITSTSFTTTVKLLITNNSSGTAYLNFLRLRATPALITGSILQIYEDTDSVAVYGERPMTINNDFIDSSSFALYLAKAIVTKYKDPKRRVILSVQGIPQLQIRDMVRVKDQDLGTYTNYRVMRIQGSLMNGYFQQKLYLREVTTSETDRWAVVGTTQVGSTTEFVGI